MKAILRKVEKKTFEVKQGKNKGNKFDKVEFSCDVIYGDKGQVKQLKGSYSMDFAKEYFEHCATITGKKMLDYIGTEVEVVTEKRTYERKEGGTGVFEYIKFLNILNPQDGKAILLPKDETDGFDF